MILVTGATGIVGSHIVLYLLKQGKEVRILHRPTADLGILNQVLRFHNVTAKPEYFEGDIQDPIALHEAAEGCHQCYHSAAMVSFNDSDEQQLAEVNTYGTKNVVNMCLARDIELCFISSTASIGETKEEGVRSERSVWITDKGKAAYTLSKRYGELEVFRGIQEGLSAVIVNPGVVIGPGNWGRSSTSIFLSGIKGMTFYPNGSNGFVDVRDIAEIATKMMEDTEAFSGQHLLIGENKSFKEVFDILAEIGGSKGPRYAVPRPLVKVLIGALRLMELFGLNRSNFSSHSLRSSITKNVYSNEKVTELGFSFRSFREAAKYTYDVYQAQKESR